VLSCLVIVKILRLLRLDLRPPPLWTGRLTECWHSVITSTWTRSLKQNLGFKIGRMTRLGFTVLGDPIGSAVSLHQGLQGLDRCQCEALSYYKPKLIGKGRMFHSVSWADEHGNNMCVVDQITHVWNSWFPLFLELSHRKVRDERNRHKRIHSVYEAMKLTINIRWIYEYWTSRKIYPCGLQIYGLKTHERYFVLSIIDEWSKCLTDPLLRSFSSLLDSFKSFQFFVNISQNDSR